MTDQEYHNTETDHCVFVKKFNGGDFLILLLYVDDMLIVGRDQAKIWMLKKTLNRTFAMKDLGLCVDYFSLTYTYTYLFRCIESDPIVLKNTC